jgi:sugar lactone lactonase YvrE
LRLREGFDPSRSPLFAELMRGSRDFDAMIARMHRDFPAASRAQAAYETVERDLVVEGLAYDAQQDSFYLSSLNRRKIVRIGVTGRQSDFVPAGRDNLLPVLGVRVDRRDRTVWLILRRRDVSQSELLHFDSLGNLLGRYAIKDSLKHGFNDLVVRIDGRVILTDSVSNQVLQFDPDAKTFIPLVVHRYLAEPNGIALADDGSELFVADDFGIVRIDLRRGVSADVDPGPHNTLAGIDGLYWHRGALIAIPNAIGLPRIAAFKLSADGLRVTCTTVLENRSKAL